MPSSRRSLVGLEHDIEVLDLATNEVRQLTCGLGSNESPSVVHAVGTALILYLPSGFLASPDDEVGLTIQPDGRITDVEREITSGYLALDQRPERTRSW